MNTSDPEAKVLSTLALALGICQIFAVEINASHPGFFAALHEKLLNLLTNS